MNVKPCPGCGKMIWASETVCSDACHDFMAEIAGMNASSEQVNEKLLWAFIEAIMPGVYKEACSHGMDAPEADPTWHCCDWSHVVDQYERLKRMRGL